MESIQTFRDHYDTVASNATLISTINYRGAPVSSHSNEKLDYSESNFILNHHNHHTTTRTLHRIDDDMASSRTTTTTTTTASSSTEHGIPFLSNKNLNDNANDDDESSSSSSSSISSAEEEEDDNSKSIVLTDHNRIVIPSVTSVDIRQMDSELAQELSSLSVQDRERALHDIHGVADPMVDEQQNPETIQNALEELERTLKQYQQQETEEQKQVANKTMMFQRNIIISNNNNTFVSSSAAYTLAESQSFEYVHRESFRLLFLRGHNFHVQNAAKMVLHHFTMKKELFGESKLCKDIALDDLTPADVECLRNGHFQLLPVCDQAGRQVFIHFMTYETYKCPTNMARAMWYTVLKALSSTEAQQKGMLSIGYNISSPPCSSSGKENTTYNKQQQGGTSMSVLYALSRTKEALPIRQLAFHFCASHGISSTILGWIRRYFMPTENRIRTRLHIGTQAECLASMERFGIPVDVFPLTEEGDLKRDRHHGWIETQQLIEKKQAQSSTRGEDGYTTQNIIDTQFVPIPGQSDILLGRGKSYQCHIGNLRFRLLLESHYESYDKADKKGKMAKAREIVELVKASGGRFLSLGGEKNNGIWTPVSDTVARKKVTHRFRAIRSTLVVVEKVKRSDNDDNDDDTMMLGSGRSGGGDDATKPFDGSTDYSTRRRSSIDQEGKKRLRLISDS